MAYVSDGGFAQFDSFRILLSQALTLHCFSKRRSTVPYHTQVRLRASTAGEIESDEGTAVDAYQPPWIPPHQLPTTQPYPGPKAPHNTSPERLHISSAKLSAMNAIHGIEVHLKTRKANESFKY
ncbi:hypothetical protein BDQ17DRAFT_1548201 [Cyathus striatus]|nr:hypothetical protein BDQ17DRAFT_1548201 [Cyathus striatus]